MISTLSPQLLFLSGSPGKPEKEEYLRGGFLNGLDMPALNVELVISCVEPTQMECFAQPRSQGFSV